MGNTDSYMTRPICKKDEEVLRAVTDPAHYDSNKKRISSALFKGANISVSRLKILSYNQLIIIFKQELENNRSRLLGTGQLSVATIEDLAKLHVEADPTETNPAHAEISGTIKQRGVANNLIKAMTFKDAD